MTHTERASVRLRTLPNGEQILHENEDGKRESINLHRLLYVAEYGIQSLERGVRLEHVNGIRWDNRIENIRDIRARPPQLKTHPSGHERFVCEVGGEQDIVSHHRLLYVAENGFDALDPEDHVHHKSGIEWDNRPGNLEAVDSKLHHWHHVVQDNTGSIKERETEYRKQRERQGVGLQ